MKSILGGGNRIACPFCGKHNITWYNGFFMNYGAAKAVNEVFHKDENRYYYETIFDGMTNIRGYGRIYSDVDNDGDNLCTESKLRMHNCVLAYDSERDSYKPKIIISLTTWNGRIHNIPRLLDNLMSCTMKPDKIVINLAVEEFPHKAADFTTEVRKALRKYKDELDVHWLKHDTKVWKKLIPTLLRYPKDIIISIDDDFEYPCNFIEVMYNDFIRNRMQNPISGNRCVFPGYGDKMHQYHCGCCSLTMYKFFKDNLQLLVPQIFDLGSDDVYYTGVVNRGGFEYLQSSELFSINMKSLNTDGDKGYSERYGVDGNISGSIAYCTILPNEAYTDVVIDYIIEEP